MKRDLGFIFLLAWMEVIIQEEEKRK